MVIAIGLDHRQDRGQRRQHHRPGAPDGGLNDGFLVRPWETSFDLVDQDHRVAHDHPGQRDQSEQRHEAEGLFGDVRPERGADNG